MTGLKALLLAGGLEGALLALGLALVRRGTPLQRLSGAFGAGTAVFALAAVVLHHAQAPPRAWAATGLVLTGLGLAVSGRALRELFRDGEARCVLLGHAAYLGAMLLAQSLVAAYSGASWAGTWCEPFLIAQSFVSPNLFTAALAIPLHGLGAEFWHYQVSATVLNGLIFFPLASWIRHPRGVLWLTLLLTFNPFVYSQSLWTWPKLLASYYVLAGADLYVRGARAWALAFVGAACLTDALGQPYLAVLVAHALISRWPVLLTPTALAFVVLLPKGKVLSELWTCLVPYPLEGGERAGLAGVRDLAFTLYNQNLLFAVGLGALTVFLAWGLPQVVWPHRRTLAPILQMAGPAFLLALVPRFWSHSGSATVHLAPFVLAMLAVSSRVLAAAGPRLKLAMGLWLAADTIWGIWLHTWIQCYPPQRWGMTGAALSNWSLKSFPLLREVGGRGSRRVLGLAAAALLLGLARSARRASPPAPEPPAPGPQLRAPQLPQLSQRTLVLGFVLLAALRLALCFQPMSDTSDTYRNLGYACHLRDAGTSLYTTFARDFRPESWTTAWPDLPYTYPPVTLCFFATFGSLGLGVFFVKLALTIMDLLVGLVFARQVSPLAGLLYFANPASLWLVSREGQFEPLVVFFLTLTILAVQRGGWVAAGVGWALAFQVKQFAVLLLPWLLWKAGSRVRLAVGVVLGFLPFLGFYLKSPGLLLFPFRYTQGEAAFNPYYWQFWGPSGWLLRADFVWTSLLSAAILALPALAWWRSGRTPAAALELLPFTLYWAILKVARYAQFWYPLASPPFLLCFRERKRLVTWLLILLLLVGDFGARRLLGIAYVIPESETSQRLARENHYLLRTLTEKQTPPPPPPR